MTLPRLIHRRDRLLLARVRQMLRSERLPPLDVSVSDKVQGWYPDTLRRAGIKLPELPAEAAQAVTGSSQSA